MINSSNEEPRWRLRFVSFIATVLWVHGVLVAGLATVFRPNSETPNDLRMRLFWETSQPFRTAESIVNRVLTQPNLRAPLLLGVEDDERFMDATIFSRFYQGILTAHDHQPPYPMQYTTKASSSSTKQKKITFRLDLAYAGQHFCGWQRQPNSSVVSVQELVESSLAVFCNAITSTKMTTTPNVRVSGRTDAGVHAVGQIARFQAASRRTLPTATSKDVFAVLEDAAAAANYTWRCLAVSEADSSFHPTFNCRSRSYLYFIDVDAVNQLCRFEDEPAKCTKLQTIANVVDELLRSLEGRELDYFAFSYGKVKTQTTLCQLHHARCRLFPGSAIAIELTGDRFLRRMVRILVATALQLAVCRDGWGSPNDDNEEGEECTATTAVTLLDMCRSKDRRATSKAAPSGGLIKLGATLT